MKTPDSSSKTPEKLREERKNYLRSQIRILEQQIDSVRSSEEYQSVTTTYQKQQELIRAEYEGMIFINKLNKEKLNKEEQHRFIKERDARIETKEKMLNQTAPYLEIETIKKQKGILSDELQAISSHIHQEKTDVMKLEIETLTTATNTLIEAVFEKLNTEEEAHLQPLIDLGMTKESALETLKTTHRTTYSNIISLGNKLSQLEELQEMGSEISPSNFEYKSDRFDYIKNQLALINQNL